jgi:hypothetical protein
MHQVPCLHDRRQFQTMITPRRSSPSPAMVFGKCKEFAKKITYRVSGATPKDLIGEFRHVYFPRIAVTVDLIATGTDIKPVEVAFFLRDGGRKSR